MRSTFRTPAAIALLLSASALAGCATFKPPEINYDASVPPLPVVPVTVTDERPKPLNTPPAWTVARGGETAGSQRDDSRDAPAAGVPEPATRVIVEQLDAVVSIAPQQHVDDVDRHRRPRHDHEEL